MSIVFIFLTMGIVVAKYVEYKYYFTPHSIKNIQLMGNIESDNDIEFEDYTYTIDTNFQGNTIIPKYTEFEKKLIDKFGFKKLNKLFDKHIINIGGTDSRVVNNILSEGKIFEKMKLENKQELTTNLLHKRVIRIQSDSDKKVIFKLYSVTPDYYSHNFNHTDLHYVENGAPDKNTILTLYDTTQEYYNLGGKVIKNITAVDDVMDIRYLDNKEEINKILSNRSQLDNLKFEKKYDFFHFTRKGSDKKDWTSLSYLPYYEISFNVSKGVNDLYLNYETYQFPNEALQIR